jgi:hypothetical protein
MLSLKFFGNVGAEARTEIACMAHAHWTRVAHGFREGRGNGRPCFRAACPAFGASRIFNRQTEWRGLAERRAGNCVADCLIKMIRYSID